MSAVPLVPPIKCQGIKTKLVSEIRNLVQTQSFERWIEPFCGSCVVALNIQPKRAILSDSNAHVVRLYQDIQTGCLTPAEAKSFLTEEGERLRVEGQSYYYSVRERFNNQPNSLDFLFLNRSCFNGVIRFNRRGKFNVPYCHKNERFAQSYVTKIVNQIRGISKVISANEWVFAVADFRATLANANPGDLVYVDPPYAGRHVDYYNSWSESDETELADLLQHLPCPFILSTWHSNEFRTNDLIQRSWSDPRFHILTRQHFYHVGSTEDLRHPMIEALITNFAVRSVYPDREEREQLAFFERPLSEYSSAGSLKSSGYPIAKLASEKT